MDPRDFLETARFLADDEAYESDFRSAVSRAYYASYLVARILLEKIFQGVVPTLESQSEHSSVRIHLRASLSNEAKTAALKLANLHDERKNSDYVLFTQVGKSEANLALEQANEIIDLLEKCESTTYIYEGMRYTLTNR